MLATLVSVTAAQALFVPITGELRFEGAGDISPTQADNFFGVVVTDVTTVSTLNTMIDPGDQVILHGPYVFNEGNIPNFLQVGGFNFDLYTSWTLPGNTVQAFGVWSGNDFRPTWAELRLNLDGDFFMGSITSFPAPDTTGSIGLAAIGLGSLFMGTKYRRS